MLLHLDICPPLPFPSLQVGPVLSVPSLAFLNSVARFPNVSFIFQHKDRKKNKNTGHLLTADHEVSVTHNSCLGRDGADCK